MYVTGMFCMALFAFSNVAVVGPLISRGGDTYKAYIATSTYLRNSEIVVVLKCGDDVVKKYFKLNKMESVFQEVVFKVK